MGKGLIGAVAKPVSGLGFLVAQASEGLLRYCTGAK
jgi:hypothetical protein